MQFSTPIFQHDRGLYVTYKFTGQWQRLLWFLIILFKLFCAGVYPNLIFEIPRLVSEVICYHLSTLTVMIFKWSEHQVVIVRVTLIHNFSFAREASVTAAQNRQSKIQLICLKHHFEGLSVWTTREHWVLFQAYEYNEGSFWSNLLRKLMIDQLLLSPELGCLSFLEGLLATAASFYK